jgi:hypothetical protein
MEEEHYLCQAEHQGQRELRSNSSSMQLALNLALENFVSSTIMTCSPACFLPTSN